MIHEKKKLTCRKIVKIANHILEKNRFLSKLQEHKCKILPSKKHFVVRTFLFEINSKTSESASKTVVAKLFNTKIPNWKQMYEQEVKNYDFLNSKTNKSISIPNRYLSMPGLIVYEYIESDNLLDLIVKDNEQYMDLEDFAQSIYQLHALGLVYEDARLRNFIVSANNFYIVDLEEIRLASQGDFTGNLGNFCSSLIDINPGIFEYIKEYEGCCTLEGEECQELQYKLENLYSFISSYIKFRPLYISEKYIYGEEEKLNPLHWIKLTISGLKKTAKRRDIDLPKAKWNGIRELLFHFFKEKID